MGSLMFGLCVGVVQCEVSVSGHLCIASGHFLGRFFRRKIYNQLKNNEKLMLARLSLSYEQRFGILQASGMKTGGVCCEGEEKQ